MNPTNEPPPLYEDTVKVGPGYTERIVTTNVNPSVSNMATYRVNMVAVTTPLYGPNPVETDCPYCHVS